MEWNLSALPGNSKNWVKRIWFSTLADFGISDSAAIGQIKELLYIVLFKNGRQLPAASTFLAKYYAIRSFSVRAINSGKLPYQGISDVTFCRQFIKEKPNQAIELFGLLAYIAAEIDEFFVEIPLEQLKADIVIADRTLRNNEQQTPVIPRRIYSHLLNELALELNEIEAVLPELCAYLKRAFACNQGEYPLPPPRLLQYSSYLGYSGSARLSEVAGWISNVYVVCATVIIGYTGMRRNEASNLPLNALSYFQHLGRQHVCIRGFTSKFNGGVAKEVSWITNQTGERAAQAAVMLAETLYRLNQIDIAGGDDVLLFPRHGFGSYGHFNGKVAQAADLPRDKLFARIVTAIEPEDVEELEQIDIERSWREDVRYAVGSNWPFSLHQLRRSLAVYAHHSGLVSMPALKAQLQHLTQEMSAYYTKGSEYAKAVVFGKDHFATEWNDARALSEYLGYAMNVLMTDERLFGGAVAWARSPAVKSSPISVYSREHALEMFKRGEIAFHETPIGGCTSTSVCESSPFRPLPLECLSSNCRNLVVSRRKLDRALEGQKLLVNKLKGIDSLSVEYRMEREGLDILEAVVQKMDAAERV